MMTKPTTRVEVLREASRDLGVRVAALETLRGHGQSADHPAPRLTTRLRNFEWCCRGVTA